jgi:hypothetical protein
MILLEVILMKKMTCICIAGDVRNSRNLDDERLVTSLKECSVVLNESYAEDILIPFDVRNGDEIVGVIKPFSKGFSVAIKMIDLMGKHGIRLYIGLGLGHLESTEATIHTMNGTAVRSAFEARDHFLKTQHPEALQWEIEGQQVSIFFYSEEYPYEPLNALTFSILEKTTKRTKKQNDVIDLIRQNSSLTYEQIGKQLGYKSPKSAISYLLTRAHYTVAEAMEDSLNDLLDELQRWFKKEGA